MFQPGETPFNSNDFSKIRDQIFSSEYGLDFKNFKEKYLNSPLYKQTSLAPETIYKVFELRIESYYWEFCVYNILLYLTSLLHKTSILLVDFETKKELESFRLTNHVFGTNTIVGFPIFNLSYKSSVELSSTITEANLLNIEDLKIKAPTHSLFSQLTLNGLFLYSLKNKSLDCAAHQFFLNASRLKISNLFPGSFLENDFFIKKSSSGSYSFFPPLMFGGENNTTFNSARFTLAELNNQVTWIQNHFESNYSALTDSLINLCDLKTAFRLKNTFPYFSSIRELGGCLYSYNFPPGSVPSFEEIALLISVFGPTGFKKKKKFA